MQTNVATASNDALDRRRFLLALVGLTVFAWLLRVYFIQIGQVAVPVRGDIREYYAYAWNLYHHGVFSHAWPADAVPAADAFRGPGYPLFLAAGMWLQPRPDLWYTLMLHAQAVLGALTVTATVLLARRWLSLGWAVLAGVLMALWPHHIAATGALLSEVVFGAALAFALWCAARASEAEGRRAWGWALASGALFGYAWLVNPLVLLLPPLLVACCWRPGKRKAAALLLAMFLLPVVAWSARGLTLPAGSGSLERAEMNFVQGSWPLYHRAYISRNASADGQAVTQAINDEIAQLRLDPAAGTRRIGTRLAGDPGYYARWYLLQKPWLLWDWDIRVGAGGVYFHEVTHSPLQSNPSLRASTAALRALNPLLFALAMAAAVVLAWGRWRRRPWAGNAATMTALAFLYFTLMHAVLQAEPRYAIPYRFIVVLLVASALAAIAAWLRARLALRRAGGAAVVAGPSEA
jgi:4-amino-4-deoxy-L-arabinose transferase-like glycosyltransferase